MIRLKLNTMHFKHFRKRLFDNRTLEIVVRQMHQCYTKLYVDVLLPQPPKGIRNQDDVLGVVNHIDQMITLLVLELRDSNFYNSYRQSTTATHSPCLEYLLSENLLVKLNDWNVHSGR